MLDRTDLIYRYDGTFDGLLSCVFESFVRKERPGSIQGPDCTQFSLFSTRMIATDPERALRVRAGISQKISPEALGFTLNAFRTCLNDRETCILDFLRLGFRVGPRVMERFSEPSLNRLYRAVCSLQEEAHLLTGLIRFSDSNGALSSVIDPKNDVLPLIMPHFLERFPGERFLIFDRTHRRALLGVQGRGRIIPLEQLEQPEADEDERMYRSLWQTYYDTIAVEGRENPVCRQTHMPKRFWNNLTEFQSRETPGEARRISAGSPLPKGGLNVPRKAANT